MNEKFYTTQESADKLGVTRQGFYYLRKRYDINPAVISTAHLYTDSLLKKLQKARGLTYERN